MFSPIGQAEGSGAAVFVQALDKAGNWIGKAAWELGIDKTPPNTAMNPLAVTQPSNAFQLSWVGTDNLSGIDYVEIQERVAQENWTTFPPIDGTNSHYWIIGQPGKSYSYRMHGVDHSRNTETYPTDGEVSTSIPVPEVLCFAPDSYDTSGNDNTPMAASEIFPDGASQNHNFCNPLRADFQNDEDWAKIVVTIDQNYLIKSIVKSSQAATVFSLFAQDGTTLLAEASPSGFGANTILIWTADRDGVVYLRSRHIDSRVIGNDVGSSISMTTGMLIFMPTAHR
jgi:hypothetical protein